MFYWTDSTAPTVPLSSPKSTSPGRQLEKATRTTKHTIAAKVFFMITLLLYAQKRRLSSKNEEKQNGGQFWPDLEQQTFPIVFFKPC